MIRDTDIINNNLKNCSQEDLKDFESDDDLSEPSFDPGSLGLLDDPGVVRFDSLDYPDFEDCDELESVSDAKLQVPRVMRLSMENLWSSSVIRAEDRLLLRTKSLSDLRELMI